MCIVGCNVFSSIWYQAYSRITTNNSRRRGNGGPAASGDVLRALADVEREHVLRVLDACGGEQARAARVLGVGRNTLWRKLRSYAR